MRDSLESMTYIENGNYVVVVNLDNNSWVKMNKNQYKQLKNNIASEESQYVMNKLKEVNFFVKQEKRKENHINSLFWVLTNKCNLSCAFCSVKSNPNVSTTNDLTLEDIEKIIMRLKKFKFNKIVLTGGEPTTRKDLTTIIQLLSKNLTKKIILQTNGLLLNEEFIQQINGKILGLEISVENIYYDENIYKKMMENLQMIRKNNVQFSFSFVWDGNNTEQLKKTIDLAVEYDALSIQLKYVSFSGNAIENNIYIKSDNEYLELYKSLANHILEENYESDNIKSLIISKPIVRTSCGANGRVLSIMADGQVKLCHLLDDDRYNISKSIVEDQEKIDQKLQHKLNDDAAMKSFNIDNKAVCSDCDIRYFCSGTCQADSENQSMSNELLYRSCKFRKISIKYNLFEYGKKYSWRENVQRFIEYIDEQL